MKESFKAPANATIKLTIKADKPADVLVRITCKELGNKILFENIISVISQKNIRFKTQSNPCSLIIETYSRTDGVNVTQKPYLIRSRYNNFDSERNYQIPEFDVHWGGNGGNSGTTTEAGAFLLLETDTGNQTQFVLQDSSGSKILLENQL